MRTFISKFRFLTLCMTVWWLSGCDPKEPIINTVSGAKVVIEWNDVVLQVQRNAPGYRPPAAARMLGYVNFAAYEAAAPGFKENKSIASSFPALQMPTQPQGKFDYQVVVNQVNYNLYNKFYPHIQASDKAKIEETYNRLDLELNASADVKSRSKAWGDAVANAVWAWAESDVLGNTYYQDAQPASYVAPVGEGLWKQGTTPGTRALFPKWGQVRSFTINQQDKDSTPRFPAYSTNVNSDWYRQAKENYDLVNLQNYNNQWIGEFWSDDIFGLTFEPASRFIAISSQIYKQDNSNLEKALLTNAKVSMAMTDAAILIWYNKFKWNIERPADYINRVMDANWKTSLQNRTTGQTGITPPFPAYPSGHAGFGAAAAAALTSIYGANYTFTDNCHKDRTEFNGAPRTFLNFGQMAAENADSRWYLGVHYRLDGEEGLRLGKLAGDKVNTLGWAK